MNPVSLFLLEDCFWSQVDTGAAPDQTPLFTGLFEGHPLAEVLCRQFGISLEDAEFEIEAAHREVEL